eukprot:TRINITY_DN15987_c0_g2_i1.p1 TRINITY_DN15987_c0_g2~~TRINITY_DN15987_c0_g2_i1.p1  ORF type:complete len:313 (+),score=64.94 TRINITY_DN15987_c0_g2_i1:561-1499(+)
MSKNQYYVSAVDLKRNPIGNEGVAALTNGIAKTNSLIHLDLRSIAFTKEGAQHLFKALIKNRTVTCLRIGNIKGLHSNFMSGKAMQGITDYLKQSLQLTFLDLKGASIGNDGLTFLLAGLKVSRSVKDVNLCFNNLTGTSTVVDLILKTYIKRLTLDENPLGRHFVAEFYRASQDQEFYLSHLSLSACELRSPGLGELFASLRKGLYLTHLRLDAAGYDDFELRHLGWFLMNCATIKEFSTASCMFGDEGMGVVAEAFTEHSYIESLNLCHNKITSEGLQLTLDKLAEKCGKSLKSLNLSHNFINVHPSPTQ